MVESERRRRILRAGAGLGVGTAVVGGGGKLLLDHARRQERNDNTVDADSREERAERAVRDYDWSEYELSAPVIDPARAEVTLEEAGTTDEGSIRYRATVTVPVADPNIDVCRHAGDPSNEWLLGQKLYEDTIRLFDASMNVLAERHPENRTPEEDRIDRFVYRLTDDGGVFEVPFTAEDAYYAGGDAAPDNLHPLSDYTEPRFRTVYRQNLRVICDA